jgi:uncharacterized RDD family membrane protein YckC
VVDRRDLGSWLEGPGPTPGDDYPGRRLGRPEHGSRSVARVGRRLLGLLIDWGLSLVIARGLLHGGSWTTLAVFLLEQTVLVGTAGASIGQRVADLRVETVAGGAAGPVRAAVRAVLLCLVVPALVWDRDLRGLHDKVAGTVLVRR